MQLIQHVGDDRRCRQIIAARHHRRQFFVASIFQQVRPLIMRQQPHRPITVEVAQCNRPVSLILRTNGGEQLQHDLLSVLVHSIDGAARTFCQQFGITQAPAPQIVAQGLVLQVPNPWRTNAHIHWVSASMSPRCPVSKGVWV
jgi:hypothetical protein